MTTEDGFRGNKVLKAAFRSIEVIERVGNKLPHPIWLFVILAIFTIVLSAVLAAINVSVISPGDGEKVAVKSLLSREGFEVIVGGVVDNYATFPPLATILTTMLGIAIAEKSGLINAVLRMTVTKVKPRYITFALSYAGMIGHVAGDAAYVTLIPLGALVFKAVGRSPVLGAIVAFVSISAGYDASPSLTTTDVLLSSISTAAAQTIDPNYFVTPTSNYFFALASSVVISLVITLVVERILSRRPDLEVDDDYVEEEIEDRDLALTGAESRGLRSAGIVAFIFAIGLVAVLIPSSSPFRGEGDGILNSPVMTGMAGIIGLFFAMVGYAYGHSAGNMEKPSDIIPAMVDGIRSMAPILVLFFVISQFLAYFKWTNIGTVVAVSGADVFQKINAPGWAILLGIAILISVMNFIVTSGSAMWALAAPVFIPMLMLLDIPPETTQAMYRVADSVTNCVTPMSPYFVMCLGFIQQYRKSAGIGTLASFTIPLAGVIWVVWIALFLIWYGAGLPFGI